MTQATAVCFCLLCLTVYLRAQETPIITSPASPDNPLNISLGTTKLKGLATIGDNVEISVNEQPQSTVAATEGLPREEVTSQLDWEGITTPSDDVDQYAKLLLHGDTDFADASDSSHSVTNRNCSIDDTEKVFGDDSISFNGTDSHL